MLTINVKLVWRTSTREGNGPTVHGWNKLAIPEFIGDTAINAALGAAWMTAGHWVGSSILTSAGHDGYAVRGEQYINPALIGCAAGPGYKWCKQAIRTIAPNLKEPSTSGWESLLRLIGKTVSSSGTAALVGVVASITAHHRSDPNYPDMAQGAALAVTGDIIIGTALMAIFTAAVYAMVGCLGTRNSRVVEMRYP